MVQRDDLSFLYPTKRVLRYPRDDKDDKEELHGAYGECTTLVIGLLVIIWTSYRIYANPCVYSVCHLIALAVVYPVVIVSWAYLAYFIVRQAIDDLKQYLTGEKTAFKRITDKE